MRSYKKIMPLFLVFALVASVFFSIKTKLDNHNAFQLALEDARDKVNKEVYVTALEAYDEAIKLNPSLALYLEAGEIYLKADDFNGATRWYEEIKSAYPKEADTYLYGIRAYALNERYKKIFEVYREYLERGLSSEDVEKTVDEFRYIYKTAGRFDEVAPFSNITGLAAVKYKDHWGYINDSGSNMIEYVFTSAGLFSDLAPTVDEAGNAMLVDASGKVIINQNYILEKDPQFGKVQRFGLYQGAALWAYNGSVWNAYSMENYDKLFGGYADVRPFCNDLAAVSKDGKKWALIDENGKEKTAYDFDEVLSDAKEAIQRTKALIVRIGTEYKLVDVNGKQIGSKTFSDAKAFADGTYAAVKCDSKWCFVDETGKIVLSTDYEEANSFCNGFAAVRKNGKWGFIRTDGMLVIPCEFNDVMQFNQTGRAFVLDEQNDWKLLTLTSYDHE